MYAKWHIQIKSGSPCNSFSFFKSTARFLYIINEIYVFQEKGKVQEMKIFDFQVSCDSTPIYDLAYSLYSGTTGDLLNNLDDYQRLYHDSLTETLREFGISAERIYSFDTFKKDWKRYCILCLAPVIFLWKIKMFKNVELPNPGESLHVSSSRLQQTYKKIVRDVILHMNNNNFL